MDDNATNILKIVDNAVNEILKYSTLPSSDPNLKAQQARCIRVVILDLLCTMEVQDDVSGAIAQMITHHCTTK